MRPSICVALVVLVALSGTQAFLPLGHDGSTHVTITSNAVRKKIHEVCEAVAESEGRKFSPTGSSAEELLRACLGKASDEVSGAKFHEALNQIYTQNDIVDRDFMTSSPHHFHNEAFIAGHTIILQGMAAIKNQVRENNLMAARETLGRVLHTVQDFYSHTNWVELGYEKTYATLIRPDLTINNTADMSTPTCKDCATRTCHTNPLLPSILNNKKLTSGYIGLFSSVKPQGKCSHGGNADRTSTQIPRGGISKDERLGYNAARHDTAVALATEATLEFLEDIRGAVGNKAFLRLMGIARSAVLCFVIDTTGSMLTDIIEAKRVTFKIIDSKKGTKDEPSEYILVPFNDPLFGPLIRTTNPEVMKAEISKLDAKGGGDEPEMCLSGLQLALTGAPPSSHIYVFTDATAKDMHLERTVNALIRSTKSTVSYFLTYKSIRSRRSVGSLSGFQVYYNLALASGGQAIEVSKLNLPKATEIILDSSTSSLVTILQRVRNPGRVESFPFFLDAAVSNITAYFIGNNLRFTLHSPSGVSQSHTNENGSLATIVAVGNLQRVQFISSETGLWNITVNSLDAYTIKVTGQSALTFIYYFVEEFKGPHPGLAAINGHPQTGVPTKLLLTVTGQNGAEALKVQEVTIVEVSGASMVPGLIEKMTGGNLLVTVNNVPDGEFVVIVKGEDMSTSSNFQRQSTTQMSVSKVMIKARVNSTMLPGTNFEVPFTVTTNGTSGVFTISAKNDRDIPMKFNEKLSVSGGSAESTVTLTPPAGTPSGTDVTLTILVEESGSANSNYAVIHLTVLAKVTDFTPPECEIWNATPTCPSNCINSTWDLSVNITDGNGSGIQEIFIQKGNGNLTQNTVIDRDIIVVMGLYSASCCSPDVLISVVDKEGNTGKCSYTVVEQNGGVSLTLCQPLWVCLLVLAHKVLQNIFSL